MVVTTRVNTIPPAKFSTFQTRRGAHQTFIRNRQLNRRPTQPLRPQRPTTKLIISTNLPHTFKSIVNLGARALRHFITRPHPRTFTWLLPKRKLLQTIIRRFLTLQRRAERIFNERTGAPRQNLSLRLLRTPTHRFRRRHQVTLNTRRTSLSRYIQRPNILRVRIRALRTTIPATGRYQRVTNRTARKRRRYLVKLRIRVRFSTRVGPV